MITSKKLSSNFIKLLLCAVLISTTSCKKDELYTTDECAQFKKGDTIFTREFYTVKKCIVLNNFPDKELIEVRDLEYTWSTDILYYEDFRFKK